MSRASWDSNNNASGSKCRHYLLFSNVLKHKKQILYRLLFHVSHASWDREKNKWNKMLTLPLVFKCFEI